MHLLGGESHEQRFLVGKLKNVPRTLETVSYTHLDVYKRQAQPQTLEQRPQQQRCPAPAERAPDAYTTVLRPTLAQDTQHLSLIHI